MKITVEYDKSSAKINVKFDNELIPTQQYDFGTEINFTELVEIMSKFDSNIEIEPKNYGEFCGIFTDLNENEKIKKVTEYLFQIFDAYKSSYKEIFEDNQEDDCKEEAY